MPQYDHGYTFDFSMDDRPMEPVRRIRPNTGCITGKRPSVKTNTIHAFESSLERDFLMLLEFNEEVVKYAVQPLTIEVEGNTKRKKYTPDVAVYFCHSLHKVPWLCEIKYRQELLSHPAHYAALFAIARRYAVLNGFNFQVFTEIEIRTHFLANLKFLSRYRHGPVNQQYYAIIQQLFEDQDCWFARDLVKVVGPQQNDGLLYTLWQLVASNVVQCDLQLPLTMTSPLRLH